MGNNNVYPSQIGFRFSEPDFKQTPAQKLRKLFCNGYIKVDTLLRNAGVSLILNPKLFYRKLASLQKVVV